MTGIDIDALRLTQEWWDAFGNDNPLEAAEAQLAKALWGIMDWLSEGEGGLGFDYNAPVGYAEGELGKALERTNIERPR